MCFFFFNFYFSQIPIVMKIRNLNKDVFMQSLYIFIDYFLGAWLVSGFGLSFICLFR